MNTPAHAVLNLWILGRKERPETALPIVLGAVLPDLPMLVFYGWAKLGRGLPERESWTRAYFEPHWQAVFDVFHSLPLILLGLLAALRWGGPRLARSSFRLRSLNIR